MMAIPLAEPVFLRSFMFPAKNNMKSVRSLVAKVPTKAPTGIAGFDEITGGGLPRGGTEVIRNLASVGIRLDRY
jgi:hypothetical protein